MWADLPCELATIRAMAADPAQDAEYAISVAQTEYRDGINNGDVDTAMAFIAEFFTWMRDGEPSYWGCEGNRAVRLWIERIIKEQSQLTITPDNTQLFGAHAVCRGWEIVETPDANGREPRRVRYRFFQMWEKQDSKWRMTAF